MDYYWFFMDCDCKNGSGYFALTSLTGQYNGYKKKSGNKCVVDVFNII